MTEEKSKLFQGLVSIVQTTLAADMETGAVTPTLIAEKVDFVADNLYPGKDIDRKAARDELIQHRSRSVTIWLPQGRKHVSGQIGGKLLVAESGNAGAVLLYNGW